MLGHVPRMMNWTAVFPLNWHALFGTVCRAVIAGAIGGILFPSLSSAQTCSSSYPHALTNGTTADATYVMADFDYVRGCLNTLQSGGTLANTTLTGTITVSNYLHTYGTGAALSVVETGSSSGYGSMRIFNDVSSAYRALEIDYSGSAYPSNLLTNGPTGESASIATTGAYALALGTSNTARQVINSSGSIRFVAYGAGTLTTDSSGNITASSDERLKRIDRQFTRGLEAVNALDPILYHWNEISGLEQKTQYAGFSAQNVRLAIPEAVGHTNDGYLTISDRPVIAATVNAIKELANRVATLENDNALLRKQLTGVAEQLRTVNGQMSTVEAKENFHARRDDDLFERFAHLIGWYPPSSLQQNSKAAN